jgi:monofunctional biosynthetic peptidoglycan transglycosylase
MNESTSAVAAAPTQTPTLAPRWRVMSERLLRAMGRALLYFVLLSLALVLLLRWLPIPISGVMIERAVQDWLDDKPDFQSQYHWQSYERIAPVMALALIAGEDQQFPYHHGFDLQQLEKALSANKRGKRLRGASTLSQQVAKNLFLWSGRSYIRKGLEAWFTVLIELLWSKQRILEVHMNIVEFGRGVYGVDAASQRFFKRPAAKLSMTQAALLAAVLPNPHRFRVDRPSAYVGKRQQWIMRQMNSLGGTAYLQALN